MAFPRRSLLITGATGYLGRPLSALALARGHAVRAFVRPGSESRAAKGAEVVAGDPFAPADVAGALTSRSTLVHLVGTPRPNPSKVREFREVDLASTRSVAAAAARSRIAHIVYVSVAHPAPVMQAYQAARIEGEAAMRATGVPVTILRPWYVLGPGHWWPYALVPMYWLFERLPSTRETARRLGLVTHQQMVCALMEAVEDGPAGAGIREVPDIRRAVQCREPASPAAL